MPRFVGMLVLTLILLLMWRADVTPSVAAPEEPSAEWPDFHGPGRTNISPETGLLERWPDQGPPLLWKYAHCGKGYSGVTIAGGRIFTAGDFGDEERILALDLNGKLLWQSPNGEAWNRLCPGSRTTPTYHDGAVYHLNPSGRLAAYAVENGRQRWAVDLKERFEAEFGIWALAENVLVEGDRVFCMPGGPKGRVVALDTRTGKTIWANTEIEHEAAYCSPCLITHRGVRQLVTLTQRSALGLDPASGRLLWSHPFVPRSPQNATTPLYHDGHLLITGGHSTGGALLRLADDSRSANEIWRHKDLDSCHGGLILAHGNVYGSACRLGGRHFFCADFLTGEIRQADRVISKVALTCAEGKLYALNHRGLVYLIALEPKGFSVVSQFNLGKRPDNSYLAHPVVCGRRLYLRYDQDLLAYDIDRK